MTHPRTGHPAIGRVLLAGSLPFALAGASAAPAAVRLLADGRVSPALRTRMASFGRRARNAPQTVLARARARLAL